MVEHRGRRSFRTLPGPSERRIGLWPPHSHANEQIVWMLTGKMEFRLGAEQRVCERGDVVVIPRDIEHEAWFREDTEVIDFFAPPRDDFLRGGKPSYMSEG